MTTSLWDQRETGVVQLLSGERKDHPSGWPGRDPDVRALEEVGI